jgi:hypothetical protein
LQYQQLFSFGVNKIGRTGSLCFGWPKWFAYLFFVAAGLLSCFPKNSKTAASAIKIYQILFTFAYDTN